MIGRGSDEFVKLFLSQYPEYSDRLTGTGASDRYRTATNIAACDLMVQPYPPGVTTRNASAIASLALGKAIVTNDGPISEELWRKEGIAAVVDTNDAEAIAKMVEELILDEVRRHNLSQRAAEYYRNHFCFDQTISTLRFPDGNTEKI